MGIVEETGSDVIIKILMVKLEEYLATVNLLEGMMGASGIIAVDRVGYRLEHAKKYNGVETISFEDYDNTGETIREITHGGADIVVDCVGIDGAMSNFEKIEAVLKLQGGPNMILKCLLKHTRYLMKNWIIVLKWF